MVLWVAKLRSSEGDQLHFRGLRARQAKKKKRTQKKARLAAWVYWLLAWFTFQPENGSSVPPNYAVLQLPSHHSEKLKSNNEKSSPYIIISIGIRVDPKQPTWFAQQRTADRQHANAGPITLTFTAFRSHATLLI